MKTMLAAAIALCDGNGRGSCPGGRGAARSHYTVHHLVN